MKIIDTGEYVCLLRGVQSEPTSGAQLKMLAQSGQLDGETFVWTNGEADWVGVGDCEGLLIPLPHSSRPKFQNQLSITCPSRH